MYLIQLIPETLTMLESGIYLKIP